VTTSTAAPADPSRPAMRGRGLAGTAVVLSELGFGAAGLGNLYRESSDEEAHGAVDAAWSSGIRYFDTAPHYGLGLSERRLGSALAHRPRDGFVVSTKVGRLLVPRVPAAPRDDDIFAVPGDLRREWDFSRDGILRSIEASLDRLGMDRLDIVYLHDPDASGIPGAAATGAATLVALREEGVVGAVGIGSNDAAAVAELLRTSDIDTAMLAGRYSLLDPRRADAVFEAAGTRSIVAAAVFNSGLLARPRAAEGAMYDYAPAPAEVIARANALAAVAEAHCSTLPQAAIAFPLENGRVASVVVGMRTAAEVEENAARLRRPSSPAMWRAMAALRGDSR
jgi:D-threo-aldose 1-dehydrogenase